LISRESLSFFISIFIAFRLFVPLPNVNPERFLSFSHSVNVLDPEDIATSTTTIMYPTFYPILNHIRARQRV
jgi:hypothetical protein